MKTPLRSFGKSANVRALSVLLCCSAIADGVHAGGLPPVGRTALPQNPSVAAGQATFATQGSKLTIQTSDRAFINWGSFNIGTGASTVFVQPSDTSVVWNKINDPNPSQILGHLNANGYVILQNPSGFYVGGDAVINAAGFIMTTSPSVPVDMWGGGAWSFNSPLPLARIINYGQINSTAAGPVFLIAHDIENHGTITAPGGNIGLHAGKEVLVSQRPDGRGLTATVKLPEGSIDNTGRLIADAGTIALHAQVVNQGGLIQANSVREKNGRIYLVASEVVNLDENSTIQARGDSQSISPGGTVLVKSDKAFTDAPTSTIDVSGGALGGNGGNVEISAARMTAIRSQIVGKAAPGWKGGELTIDPDNIVLGNSGDPAPPSGTVNPGDPPSAGSDDTLYLDVNSFAGMSQINLQATRDITLSSGTTWNLGLGLSGSTLTLQAGRNITLEDLSGIMAGNGWSINMIAGSELTSAANRQAGFDGIYLQGNSFIQTRNGGINLIAGNEVIVNSDAATAGNNGIRTMANGSINVTAVFGDVNSGANVSGYRFRTRGTPLYTVSTTLGGISTAAGGDVTITAGGDVTSYSPTSANVNESGSGDAGSGAFGLQPGNVTVNAGGNVYGHYVIANGVGTITAGGDAGGSDSSKQLALSLVKGGWFVRAGGNITLQEVRNPNGIYNDAGGSTTSAAYHLFDYDRASFLDLDAGLSVFLTGSGVPRPTAAIPPVIFPPSLAIKAGQDIVLNQNIILFPSALGDLRLFAGRDFLGQAGDGSGTAVSLSMSDSAQTQWQEGGIFGPTDHGPLALQRNNLNSIHIDVGRNAENLAIFTIRKTEMDVGGDLINTSFVGANLHDGDTTSIDVKGDIKNTNPYNFTFLQRGIVNLPSIDALHPSSWLTVFSIAVDPAILSKIVVPKGVPRNKVSEYAATALLFSGNSFGFLYNPTTKRLGYFGVMPANVRNALVKPVTVLRYGPDGFPLVDDSGHFVTANYTFADAHSIDTLYLASLKVPAVAPIGYQIGGPGFFDIHARSMELGNTDGILSYGVGGPLGDANRYTSLVPYTRSGAEINVTLDGDLNMFASTIASFMGGDVNVTSKGGKMELGSQELFNNFSRFALGIYTTGHSDVHVEALNDINIDGSRIAAYNGGSITVKSDTGDVNVGSGGNSYVNVHLVSVVNGRPNVTENTVFGSGLVATTLPPKYQTPGGSPVPGDITVETPQGSIFSSKAGILQLALDGNVAGGPTVTLKAGSPGFIGDIDLGDSGVIGGTVNLTASGDIKGLVISRQDSSISAGKNFSGNVLSAGSATLKAGGSVSGTIIGVGSVNVSGDNLAAANLVGTDVNAGGKSLGNTLGSTAGATSVGQNASSTTTSDTAQEKTTLASAEDDEKKKAGRPLLAKTTGRVTVILPEK